jgi:hypothetical protein
MGRDVRIVDYGLAVGFYAGMSSTRTERGNLISRKLI